ncbi:prealbumin-like fold domain-containing protein [Streptomyces sp. NPDC004609]|uniref:prealbumin-like fold domain-containing protein n=1 Tax=Streptomyces sp. NPDC004609 TaxID=3364704 RepID=UPI0036903705
MSRRASSPGRSATASPGCPGCSTDSAGSCVFDELGAGTYWLRETGAPKGHVLPENPVTGPYVITAANADEPVTVKIANRRGEPGKGTSKGGKG